jgi:protein phosphatase
VLQKALGGNNQFVDPQVGSVPCETGDQFLICSDGLVEGLYDHLLLEILRPANPGQSGENPARALLEAASARDGHDNITALVIEAE